MRLSGLFTIFLILLCRWGNAETLPNSKSGFILEDLKDSIAWADYYYNIQRYQRAIPLYEKSLENPEVDTELVLKKLALSEAALENGNVAVERIYDYLSLDFNPPFILHEGFDPIREHEDFKELSTAIMPKITGWSIIYFFVALIGFYVVVIILLNKKINRTAGFLIAAFLFIHSFFILNISINRAHYIFEFPHTYLMSTWASFLYGPLLYFYFKRITNKYSFRAIDLFHLVPTVLLIFYLIPNVYAISSTDKIAMMLSRLQDGLGPHDSNKLLLIVVLKIISLTAYGYFINRVYGRTRTRNVIDKRSKTWQKNIYHIHISYVIIYTLYGFLIINGQSSGLLFNASVASMSLMVLYIGYSANIQPHVFSGAYEYVNRLFPKYEKSGLTESLSLELKEEVEHLFSKEKIYRENDISLEMLASRLNTTRHNTSQVINEHFEMSFHELVNKYRIAEAKEILQDDSKQKWNIIDIAYEVGYNNKVTFNKAFKKETHITPSQYQRNSWSA